jgi:hypothetical protein
MIFLLKADPNRSFSIRYVSLRIKKLGNENICFEMSIMQYVVFRSKHCATELQRLSRGYRLLTRKSTLCSNPRVTSICMRVQTIVGLGVRWCR